jgi:DNA-binding beta-propeller fold protein YncE
MSDMLAFRRLRPFSRAALISTTMLAAFGIAVTALAQTQVPTASSNPAPATRDLVFVGARDALIAYDLSTGTEVASIPNSNDTTDLQVTSDGVLLANHRGGMANPAANGVIAVDARTGAELARMPSSTIGGMRPVHAYLTPMIDGRQFFISANDGNAAATARGVEAADSELTAIDVTPGSQSRFTVVGEVRAGNGHHKLAFSPTSGRFSASNIADCDEVIGLYRIAADGKLTRTAAIDAAQLGFDGSSREKTCDATGREGIRLSPHGAVTAPVNGRHVHNLNGSGQFVMIDAEADVPKATILDTQGGSGGANMTAHLDGRTLYGAQFTPREGGQGARAGQACQIGQIAVIDAAAGVLTRQVPIRLDGPDCTRNLAGTDEALVRPAYSVLSGDSRTLFITLGTLGGASPEASQAARSRKLVMFDLSEPSNPRQLASLDVGAAHGHRDLAVSADGRLLFVPSNRDHTLSVIDMTERRVLRSFRVAEEPNRVAAFGPGGPSRPTGPVPLLRSN